MYFIFRNSVPSFRGRVFFTESRSPAIDQTMRQPTVLTSVIPRSPVFDEWPLNYYSVWDN
jgi:hypothetical protein